MGRVKQALLEVEDFVAGCLGEGRTLNQTIRDAEEAFKTAFQVLDMISGCAWPIQSLGPRPDTSRLGLPTFGRNC